MANLTKTMVNVGDVIFIDEMKDEPLYKGKIGKIDYIDNIGQLHGDWGGCAVIPGEDKYDECSDYFKYLEQLRQSGATNMFGARPYLERMFDIEKNKATTILAYWMQHYSELKEKYQWR